jgi:hypothetical protein
MTTITDTTGSRPDTGTGTTQTAMATAPAVVIRVSDIAGITVMPRWRNSANRPIMTARVARTLRVSGVPRSERQRTLKLPLRLDADDDFCMRVDALVGAAVNGGLGTWSVYAFARRIS